MSRLLALSFLGAAVAVATFYVLSLVQNVSDTTSPPQGSGAFFDKLAPRYDLLNRAISLGLDQSWRRAAAQAASPPQNPDETRPMSASALDVATGTGDLALILALSGDFDEVHAIDPSQEMLSRLRSKAGAAVQSLLGAAESLPFSDGRFHAVTVAFGVRNFADRTVGLSEMARVLAPGGRLVVLEASVPAGRGLFQAAARFFIRRIMPLMGATLSGRFSDYNYLSTSMAAFPQPEEFVRLLRLAGLQVEKHERLWPFGSGPDLYVAVKI
jgi:demethylmenaquinone methyltransferase / 2-methoxy-6-polyprenyl-1,4-benzoquinol methylase